MKNGDRMEEGLYSSFDSVFYRYLLCVFVHLILIQQGMNWWSFDWNFSIGVFFSYLFFREWCKLSYYVFVEGETSIFGPSN